VPVHPTCLAWAAKSAGPSLYHLLEVLGKDASWGEWSERFDTRDLTPELKLC